MIKIQKKEYYDIVKRALELKYPIIINYNDEITQEKVNKLVNDYIVKQVGELADAQLDARVTYLIELINETKTSLKQESETGDNKLRVELDKLNAKISNLVNSSNVGSKAYTDNEITKLKQWVIDRETANTPTDAEIDQALS